MVAVKWRAVVGPWMCCEGRVDRPGWRVACGRKGERGVKDDTEDRGLHGGTDGAAIHQDRTGCERKSDRLRARFEFEVIRLTSMRRLGVGGRTLESEVLGAW